MAWQEKDNENSYFRKGVQKQDRIQAKNIRFIGKPSHGFYPLGMEMYDLCRRSDTFDNLIIFQLLDPSVESAQGKMELQKGKALFY